MTRHTLFFVEKSAPMVHDALHKALDGTDWTLVDPTTQPADYPPAAVANDARVGLTVWRGTRYSQDFFRFLAKLLRSGVERFVLLAPGAGEDRPWDHPRIPPWEQQAFQAAFTVCSAASKEALLQALTMAITATEATLRPLMRATVRILPEDEEDRFLVQVMSRYPKSETGQLEADVNRAFEALSDGIGLTVADNPSFNWQTELDSIELGDYVRNLDPRSLPRKLAEVRAQRPAGSAQALAGSEHLLARDLEGAIRDFWKPEASDSAVTKAAVELRLVELMRDIGNCLAAGTGPWARRELCDGPLKVLLIDDQPKRISPLLECAFKVLGPPGAQLYKASDDYWRTLKEVVEGDRSLDEVACCPTINATLTGKPCVDALQACSEAGPGTLDQYDVILVDIEFEGRSIGASIVRQIAMWLDMSEEPRVSPRAGGSRIGRPRMIVLSLSKDTEQIQQALNLGAEAYVFKERVFGLPAVLAGGGTRGPSAEARGSRSAFRSLYRLPPRVISSLQRPEWLIHPEDNGCRPWVQGLPKSDLHHHIGTCISLGTIKALAWNTCALLRGGKTGPPPRVAALASRTCALVSKALTLLSKFDDLSPAEALWLASSGNDDRSRVPRERLLDDVVNHLLPDDQEIKRFEASALLVTVISLAESNGDDCVAAWAKLEELDRLWDHPFNRRVRSVIENLREPLSRTFVNSLTGQRMKWNDVARVVRDRTTTAHAWLKQCWNDATAGKTHDSLSLAETVCLPRDPKPSDHSLTRYLWGSGLLGAEHLQSPENIILAAMDLAEQAIEDNIVYSEIRCATTGYTRGGMSAIHATDLLCASLDLSTACLASHDPPRRWVRFNLLLGAKRDKTPEEFSDTVNLLNCYLQRGAIATPDDHATTLTGPPRWWQPCGVVGFDLSGDERTAAEKFKDLVRPLFRNSANITIHAGEAASAESIWQAVYELGARRIGHGLRLREDGKLLEYCITEGICMEMCPISNAYTGAFESPESRTTYDGTDRRYYPLRYYMERGLEVCVGTDNRFLHQGRHTLTDEYVEAAKLVGGLTRWEVLKLVRAGFKHAFLPKYQVETLLRAVEEEIFSLVTAEGSP